MPKTVEGSLDSSISRLVTTLSERKPLLGNVISMHGAATLGEYAREIRRFDIGYTPIQPRSEVVAAVVTEAQRTLGQAFDDGESIVAKLRTQLERMPVFLTGNHHGPDFAASMHQGTQIFSLAVESDSIIPVLAGGTIPLDSPLTRPSSILLADGSRRANVFTGKKHSRSMVTASPSFTPEMVKHAKNTVSGKSGYKFSPKEADAMIDILDTSYMPTAESGIDNYSDQSVILNRRLWQQAHSDELDGRVPDLAFLELERVTNHLLLNDLQRADTITHQGLFDKQLRSKILKNLNGVAGCWDDNEVSPDGEVRNQTPSDKGTTFFWGLDKDGRRYSLRYTEINSKGYLVGSQQDGTPTEIELTPQAIIDRIKSETGSGNRIVPSLFTVFLEIAFAHGFKCEGGARQIEYLTKMRHGLATALVNTGRNEWAEKVQKVPTENLITRLTTTYTTYPDDSVHRAGLVEVIANGGYTNADMAKITSMTVADAILPIYANFYPLTFEEKERDPKAAAVNEKVIYEHLGEKAVRKDVH